MALKEYEVMTEGRHPHKTTMLLNDADAKRLGVLKDKPASKRRTPANKGRGPATKKPAAPKAPPASGGVEDASDPGASD